MGVPAFFKWLTLRYPQVVMDAIEEINTNFDINNFLRTKYNADTSMPFIDNVYLDMNGIIHPCCHPQDGRPQPNSEEEMFNNIFDYTDKLIKILKPKKLIYLAVDGVAPRAKMNQQRSRRFRAAQEAREKSEKESELIKEWKDKGLDLPENNTHRGFDSNTITPGTDFMHRLAQALKIYIAHRLQHDSLWQGLTVIFSDSNVPGEGEHKILEFIRLQRQQDHYDPNTKHCIYGADADLIMLSLITHEPNFFIIRESLNENIWKKCESCGKNGHFKDECPKLLNPNAPVKDSSDLINEIEFSLIKVHVVREYLELEFRHTKLNFSFDEEMKFERFIDDFVFLCFFVGNDFIPHLPSLKIREGAIDALMYIYKKVVPELDGFLTEGNGTINLARTEILLKKLALVEDAIFQKQLHAKHRELERNAQRAVQSGRIDRSQYQDHIVSEYFKLNKKVKECELTNTEEIKLFDDILDDIDQIIERDEEEYEKEKERKELLNKKASDNFQRVLKEVLKKDQNKKMETYKDPVRLGEVGWKDRYYLEKFKVQPDDPEFKKLIRQSYIEGICWVYAYYYNGCASWEWYYPFHYAPFASDLCEIKDLEVKFKKGVPFEPIHQLLSVLPPYSSKALPQCLRQLMHDPFSELSDFYPDGIKLDINGQPYAWMGVNLIPFIDEHRIRKAVESRKHLFSDEENTRNRFGDTLVFYNQKNHFISKHAVGDNFKTPGYYTYISTPHFRVFSGKIKALNDLSHNINNVQPGKSFKSSIKGLKISEVRGCEIVSMNFENPPSQPHTSQLRKGVLIPPKVVLEDNLDYYCKRNFKGSDAIDLVRRVLGYDLDEAENRMRAELFDHTSNNNRAIEYDPYEMDMLRKKRYKQFHNDDGREGHNTDTRRSHDCYDSRGHYREGHNTDTRRSHDSYDSRREKSSSNYDRHYHHRYEDKRHYNQRNYSDNTYSNSNRRPNNREYATRQVPQHQSADYYNNNNAFNKFSDPSLRANSNMLANTGNMMPQNNSNANQGNVQKEINQGLNDLLKNYQTYVGKNNK